MSSSESVLENEKISHEVFPHLNRVTFAKHKQLFGIYPFDN